MCQRKNHILGELEDVRSRPTKPPCPSLTPTPENPEPARRTRAPHARAELPYGEVWMR